MPKLSLRDLHVGDILHLDIAGEDRLWSRLPDNRRIHDHTIQSLQDKGLLRPRNDGLIDGMSQTWEIVDPAFANPPAPRLRRTGPPEDRKSEEEK